MAFDPSIISQIADMAPNPVAAREQGYKLADMATGAESNRLQLGQQKQQIADTEKAKNILKGTKLDSPQDVTKAAEKLTQAGLPDEAMKFMKAVQGLQESKGQLTLQQYQLMAAKSDMIGGSVATLVGQYDQMIQGGATPALAAAVMQPKYQQAIQQLSQSKLPDGSPALGPQDLQQIEQHGQFDPQFLRMVADRSKQGSAALQAQMKHHADERASDIAEIRAKAETRMEQDERRKIAADAEKVREDKEKDAARLAGIPEPLQPGALDTAARIVMTDPSRMKDYTSMSAKDPRKNQINNYIDKIMHDSGMKFQDLERLRQNWRSENKSIDKMQVQLDGIETFEGLARGNGERVLELIAMVDDTSVPLAEGFLRSTKRKLGGIDAGELAGVLNSFQGETARIIGGNPNMTGVVTDSARKDIQAIAPQSMTAKQAERNIRRLFTEMDLRKDLILRQIDKAQKRSIQTTPNEALPERNPDGSLKTPQPTAGGGPTSPSTPPPAASPGAAAQPQAAAPGAGQQQGDDALRSIWGGTRQ